MIEVGPPPKQPLPSGGAAAASPRAGAPAIPVQLVEPATLPGSLPANGTLAALVEPGGQAGIGGDLVQLSTDQGPLTIQTPVSLAAGTRVTLQLATIAGRAQLFLIPPRPSAEIGSLLGKAAIVAPAAKPALVALLPGRAVTATVVRAAPRAADAPPPAESAATDATIAAPEAGSGKPAAAPPAAFAAPAAGEAAAGAEVVPPAGAPAPPANAGLQAAKGAAAPAAAGPAALPSAAGAAPVGAAPAGAAPPAAPSAAVAAGQPFAGMAAGEQLTLTVISVAAQPPTASQAAAPVLQAPAAAAPAVAAADAGSSKTVEPAALAGAKAGPANAAAAAPPSSAAGPLAASPAGQATPAPATPALTNAAAAAAAPGAAANPAAPLGLAPAAASGAVLSAATPAAGAITVAASVVGSDAAGQPIVEAGSVLLVLEAKAPPVGSEILLALPRAQSETAPAAAASLFAPLEEAAREAATQGGPLQQAIAALLPRPGPALAAQLALFVGALRQGSVSGWLGKEAADQLDKIGKGRTSQRLGAAFAELTRASAGAERGAGWLSLTLPLVNAGVIQPIQLYVQRRRDEEEKEQDRREAEQGRRFLIDFTLTRLGGVQLDGMARAGRLDLIVRTVKPMATSLRGELDRLFADVTSARGLAGALIFQVAPPVAPIPRPAPQQQAGGGILV